MKFLDIIMVEEIAICLRFSIKGATMESFTERYATAIT